MRRKKERGEGGDMVPFIAPPSGSNLPLIEPPASQVHCDPIATFIPTFSVSPFIFHCSSIPPNDDVQRLFCHFVNGTKRRMLGLHLLQFRLE